MHLTSCCRYTAGITRIVVFFFFNDTATTEIYTLSLHDALPISGGHDIEAVGRLVEDHHRGVVNQCAGDGGDRKSTRLNSSHGYISYAVFCLKKKKKENTPLDSISSSTRDCAFILVDCIDALMRV